MRKGLRPLFLFPYICSNFIAMKKFFLFKRRDVNLSSTSVSDNGEGLDVLAIPVDSMAFMNAEYGKINIVFNNATIYEESSLLDGESFKKTSVSVSCTPGSEADLIEDILKFISSINTASNVMRFDAVLGKATASKAIVNDFTDVISEVKQYPVSRVSQKSSTNTFIGGTAGTAFGTGNVLESIDFGEGNKPVIDLSESNIGHSSSNVNGWTNTGSGGSTYNVSSISGTVAYTATGGATVNGLSTASADIETGEHLELANNYVAKDDFTFYCVIGRTKSQIETSRFMGPVAQGPTANNLLFMDTFGVDEFKILLRNTDDPEGVITIPVDKAIISPDQTTYVFVIRRDKDSNIFVHDATGSVVGIAEANLIKPNVTNGDFFFRYIGDGGSNRFQGNVARIGVIEKDIGTSAASKLALDLASRYTPKK